MKASTKRFASILIAVAFLVFAVLVYSNLMIPLYAAINEQRAILAEKNNQLNEFKQLSETYKKINDSFKENPNSVAGFNEAMPLDPQIPAEINQLTALITVANTSVFSPSLGNLALSSINVKENFLSSKKETSIVKGKGTLKFDMNATGSYEAFRVYLDFLEKNSRIISVNSLNIKEDPKIPGQMTFDLSLDAYYQMD